MRALTLDSNNLFRDRSFTLYFLAGAISGAGSTITLVVLPILVFQLTQSASSLLVVYAVRALSFSDTDARIGLFFTAGAVGSLLASLALPRLTKSISPARLV